jgi:hypothetical protein
VSTSIWDGADRLIDAAPTLPDLRAHGLQLLAARRWRSLGRPVPDELLDDEVASAMTALAAPAVLEQVRAAVEGPILLFKGPAAARWYPDPQLRPFLDLDLLVSDAPTAQRRLTAAGFVPVGDPELFIDIHHLRPLRSPSFPLHVEIHSQLKWVEGLRPPPVRELLAVAEPARAGVNEVLVLPPGHHALVLAAHAWAHEPLSRLLRVLDIAAVLEGADRDDVAWLARDWGIAKVWRATTAVADAVLLGGRRGSLGLRLWTRNLARARETTVVESHVRRVLAPFWALPPHRAARACAASIGSTLRPMPDEQPAVKARRAAAAVRHASMQRSRHEGTLNTGGSSGQ